MLFSTGISQIEILSQNNRPIVIKKARHSLFDDIVGFEDVKQLFEMAIEAERLVHLLLCGPPSSGKSLFMSSLTRLERSYYAVGSSSTKSGIFDSFITATRKCLSSADYRREFIIKK